MFTYLFACLRICFLEREGERASERERERERERREREREKRKIERQSELESVFRPFGLSHFEIRLFRCIIVTANTLALRLLLVRHHWPTAPTLYR